MRKAFPIIRTQIDDFVRKEQTAMMKKITALLLVLLLLAGCSAVGDVETLLRAPQLSGESAALQKALNSYLGGSATLKYPASGDFLSPFAFGDWDGDGVDEAAVLYTADTTSSNVWLAVLEPSGESGWACQSGHRGYVLRGGKLLRRQPEGRRQQAAADRVHLPAGRPVSGRLPVRQRQSVHRHQQKLHRYDRG